VRPELLAKIPHLATTISPLSMPASARTLWPAHKASSSMDRQIGAYSVGLTIPGKLNCTFKKKKKSLRNGQRVENVFFLSFANFVLNEFVYQERQEEKKRKLNNPIELFLLRVQ
jgi:hypothetical protein